jgi:putative ABC transport system permease protein
VRLWRALRLSRRALAAHRLRASLAVASVAVGVAALVLTRAVGQGAQEAVARTIEAMGADLVVVKPAPVRRLAARTQVRGLATTLSPDDGAAIAALPSVLRAAPAAERALRVKAGTRAAPASVLGTTPAFEEVRNLRLRSGRFFDAEEEGAARRVAVLGARVADALFPGEDATGRSLRVRGVPFEVVGVLEARGVMADGSDEDGQVIIPLRTALRRVFNTSWLTLVFVRAADQGARERAAAEIAALLRERHGLAARARPDDFAVQGEDRMLAGQRDAAASLTLLTSALGALALLVGGAGILALMLLSVKERTPEIGLRMAVGARPRDVLAQFLLEAAALAVGGWAAGLALAGLGAVAVRVLTAWPLAVPRGALAASLAMAAGTGLVFGALPARAAARLPPVQALGRA